MARADYQQIGVSGLDITAGEVRDEFQRELQGKRGIETYREMTTDPVVAAILYAIEHLIRPVQWAFNPPEDGGKEADETAEFFDAALHDMSYSWEDTVAEFLSFIPYGWSYHEEVYKLRQGDEKDPPSRYDDGLIGWRKFAVRSQDSLHKWEFDKQGGIQGMWQLAAPDFREVLIPIQKSLLLRTTVNKGNPEGKSVLRGAYRPHYFKKHIENIEGIGLERDLAGLPVAWVPDALLRPTATLDEKAVLNSIRKTVRNIRRDAQEGLVMPLLYDNNGNQMYKLELMSSGGSRQFDTDKIISRYDQRIAMVVLADFILLGHEKVGSFALSSDKTDLFATALRTFLGIIQAVMNQHAVPRLMKLNGFDRRLTPELVFGDIERANIGEVIESLSKLAAAGMPVFPHPELEKHLYEGLGLPEPLDPEEQEALKPEPVAPPPEPDPDGEPDPDAEDAIEEEAGKQATEPSPFGFHGKHNQKTHGRRSKGGVMSQKGDNGWEPVDGAKKPSGGATGGQKGKPSGEVDRAGFAAATKAYPFDSMLKMDTLFEAAPKKKELADHLKAAGVDAKTVDAADFRSLLAMGKTLRDGEPGAAGATATIAAVKPPKLPPGMGEKEQRDHGKAWGKTLDADEFDGIVEYQGPSYGIINSILRGKVPDTLPKGVNEAQARAYTEGVTKRVDAALRKGSAPRDFTTYRGTTIRDPKPKIGDIITDKAFMSTSADRDVAEDFASGGGQVITFAVKKGQPGGFIDGVNDNGEAEFLLPRDTSYRITGVDTDGNYLAEFL